MLRKMDYIGVQSEALLYYLTAKLRFVLRISEYSSLSKGYFTLLRQAQQLRQVQRTSDLRNISDITFLSLLCFIQSVKNFSCQAVGKVLLI